MSLVENYPQPRQTGNHVSIRSGMDGFTWREQTNARGEREKIKLVANSHDVPNESVIIVSPEEQAAERAEVPFDGLSLSVAALGRVLRPHEPEWTRPDLAEQPEDTLQDIIEAVA